MHTIDLHAHTTASDGTLTPTELIGLARSIGLTAVAVTDHDTMDGLAEAGEAARASGIEFVRGIELAIEYPHGKLHMLGYLLDDGTSAAQLGDRLMRLKTNRANRNYAMVERLQSLGLPITLDEIAAESGSGQIGRPHMALALLKKGIVTTTQEAFDVYLADGAAAHVPKDKIELEEGLALIHDAGGIASVAHPSSLKLQGGDLAAELDRLKSLGLDGVECYYSQHTPEFTASLLAMAAETGLLVTGGSDFHGASKPHVHLGRVEGDRPAPNEILDALKARKAARR